MIFIQGHCRLWAALRSLLLNFMGLSKAFFKKMATIMEDGEIKQKRVPMNDMLTKSID